MTTEQREQEAALVADFRYGIIGDLANPYLSREDRRRLLREKARVLYEVPGRGRKTLTASCLRKWLRLYQKHGKVGLMPHRRCDSGAPRTLSAEEAALLLSYLETHPQLCASVALHTLQQEGKITSDPSSSSLSRLVSAAGMERQKRSRLKEHEQNLKFDFELPLECVQADGLYTVPVPDAKGKRRQAILLAFLDDATRRVVFAGFGFSENSLLFEQGIRHILRAHGRIGREYHRSPHRGLGGKTPLEAWVEKASAIVAVDPSVDYQAVFDHEAGRKVYKDSTVTLDGVLYEVPSTLIGERVSLFYDPLIPAPRRQLLIRHDGRECGMARKVDSYANSKVRRSYLLKDPVINEAAQTLPPMPAASSPVHAALSASRVRLDGSRKEARP